jgi:hypothetical protein
MAMETVWKARHPFGQGYSPLYSFTATFMGVAQLWDTMTIDERVKAVEELQRDSQARWRQRLADPTAFAYTSLVQQPAFVAGVIDNRGSLFVAFVQERHQQRPTPVLAVSTPNRSLLAALHQQYGGRIAISRSEAGRENLHWSLRGSLAGISSERSSR